MMIRRITKRKGSSPAQRPIFRGELLVSGRVVGGWAPSGWRKLVNWPMGIVFIPFSDRVVLRPLSIHGLPFMAEINGADPNQILSGVILQVAESFHTMPMIGSMFHLRFGRKHGVRGGTIPKCFMGLEYLGIQISWDRRNLTTPHTKHQGFDPCDTGLQTCENQWRLKDKLNEDLKEICKDIFSWRI